MAAPTPSTPLPEGPPPCVHIDAQLLVLDKPAGLLSVPGRGEAGAVNLRTWAERHWSSLGVVHRLDMATSGLIAFARDAATLRALSGQFERREVGKCYEAIVDGWPEDDSGEIDLPLAADWPRRPRQKVCRATGRPALTRWRVLERSSGPGARWARLGLEPVTGRSHQLRVHLASIGHPIVGDALYGRPVPGGRLLLHASRLALAHPADQRGLELLSPCPF